MSISGVPLSRNSRVLLSLFASIAINIAGLWDQSPIKKLPRSARNVVRQVGLRSESLIRLRILERNLKKAYYRRI